MISIFQKDGIYIISVNPQRQEEKDFLEKAESLVERDRELRQKTEFEIDVPVEVSEAQESVLKAQADSLLRVEKPKANDEYEQLLLDLCK